MFAKEQAQYQLMKQPGMRRTPAAPSGIIVPGEANWNVKKSRNKLENNQVHADGFKRKSARGNHSSTGGGTVIYNLALLGHWLDALCDGLTSTPFTGVLRIDVTDGGSGYTTPPTVTIAGTTGAGATAVSVLVGDRVEAVIVTNPGANYTGPMTVTFGAGGGGAGAAATAVLDAAKIRHDGTLKTGVPTFYLVEKGVVGKALWRRYYDFVLRKLSFSDAVEGICTMTDEWTGSGELVKNAASIDATPAEVTGENVEYASCAILEAGAATGVISDLSMDFDCTLMEKRPPVAISGKATEIVRGGWAVGGSGNAWFENEDLLSKTENGVLTDIVSILSSAEGVFMRRLPEVEFETTDWERSDNGLVVPFTYASIKNASAAAPVEFTLINDVAEYPAAV